MALMMVRASYTPEAFRGLMDNPQNRREALTTVWADVGCVLKELYYSSSQSGWVMIVHGNAGTLLENQSTTWLSGALASYTAEILHTPEDVFEASKRANAKAGRAYDAPNRDEIDRMLLDE